MIEGGGGHLDSLWEVFLSNISTEAPESIIIFTGIVSILTIMVSISSERSVRAIKDVTTYPHDDVQ